MGGKTKQSQRTKNNVRPSSSSRSAELLSNSMTLDTGMVTTGSGKVLPALFPTLAAVNLEQGLNPEFQMCIKKLNKKDPITRVKALQELNDLVNNSNVDDVVAALPSWAHFYKTLTADTDRKVREITQLCHGSLVRASGRRAAPVLRALLPAWLQAQYDEHAPAQAHAHNSLKNTFPDSKLPEVISFCKAEVMAHFLDNLIGNAEAVINKKIDEEEDWVMSYPKPIIECPDERSATFGRVVTSSLRGLEYFVPRLPAPHAAWLWAALTPLLDHHAFWKFATHDMHQVRAAWLGALGRVLERFPGELAARAGGRALRVLLAGARDRHTLVAAQLWTCLLVFMHNVPDWQQYLEKKDLLVKRILDVLETGGWGDARHLSTMLLPILAHLPPDVLTKQFYEAFFKAVYIGLDKKTILSSKSERQSWITSLAECLRYLSIQQDDFVVEITTSVHRTWIEKVLSTELDTQTRNNLIKCSAANMTSIVKYWLKQSKEENSEKYDQLLRNFWQNICSTVLLQIDKCSTELSDIEKLMDGHILLLQSLKTSFMQETKKQQSIKFVKLEGDEPSVPETRVVVTPPCDEAIVDRYQHNLEDLVYKIIAQYFEIAAKKQLSGPILNPLITLIVEFDSKGMFEGVARQLGAAGPYQLYDAVLRGWLAGDTMRCKALLEIIFMIIKYLTEDEQDAVFNSFDQLSPCVVEWCLSLSAAHPHALLSAARRWARGPAGAAALGAVARRAAQHHDARAAALLLVCLADAPDGEPLVSAAGVSQVASEVSAALTHEVETLETDTHEVDKPAVDTHKADTQEDNTHEADTHETNAPEADTHETDTYRANAHETDTHRADAHETDTHTHEACGRLAARLVTILAPTTHAHTEHFATLVIKLFTLNFSVPLGDSRMSGDTWRELRSSWQDGLAALQPPARRRLRHDAAAIMHDRLRLQLNSVNIKKLEQILSLAPSLYVRGGDDDGDGRSRADFTALLLPAADERAAAALRACALRVDCVTARLNCLYDDDDDVVKRVVQDGVTHDADDLDRDDLVRHVNLFLMRAIHLRNLFLQKIVADDEDEEDSDEEESEPVRRTVKTEEYWCDTLLSDEYFESAFCKILYDYVVVASLYDGYKFCAHYDVIEETKNKMDVLLSDVIGVTSPASRARLVTSLTRLAAAHGYYWAYAHRYYVVSAMPQRYVDVENGLITNGVLDITSGNGFFHMLQACNRFSGSETLQYKTAYVVMLRSWLLAQAAPGAEEFVQQAALCQPTANLDVIITAYYRHQPTMLYERDISDAPWSQVVSNATVVEFLTLMVQTRAWEATSLHWDFATITMSSLVVTMEESRGSWGSSRGAMLSCAALRLLRAVHDFVLELPAECQRRTPPPHIADLITEWREIFAPESFASLYRFIVHVLDSCTSTSVSAPAAQVLEALVGSVSMLRWSAARERGGLTLQALAAAALRALVRASHPAHKHLAYSLLHSLAKDMVYDDSLRVAPWNDEERDLEAPRPRYLLDALAEPCERLAALVGAALQHIEVGEETCELVSMSDSHSLALGWLLLADVQAQMAELAKGDLKQFYIRIFRECNLTPPLLATALRLLPAEVFTFAADSSERAVAPPHAAAWFLDVQPFSMSAARSGGSLAALACRAVYRGVCGAGCGPARGWWGALAPRAGRLLQRAVTAYVAPHLARAQLRDLQQRAKEIQDAEIHIAWSTNEVVCSYTVEESVVELHVWLSRAHPLVPPRLTTPGAPAAVPNTHWLALYLAYQNGTLLNALKMWTHAVNARVEKAPQCYICYCRLHPSSGHLPRVPCHQCKNKFHNLCLRKWFASSHRSNCPLCRATF